MSATPIDLNLASPPDIPKALRNAAQAYIESRAELQAAWNDENAGRVWTEFAKIMERAAGQCDRAIAKHFK